MAQLNYPLSVFNYKHMNSDMAVRRLTALYPKCTCIPWCPSAQFLSTTSKRDLFTGISSDVIAHELPFVGVEKHCNDVKYFPGNK